MFCPNCGKDCGEFKFCPECGTQVRLAESNDTVQKEHSVFPEPPITLKKVRWGTLEFLGDSMQVIIKLPKIPRKNLLISYDEILDVSYVPATKWLNGFLCVREWKERHIPIPKNHLESTLKNVTTWLEKKIIMTFFASMNF